MEQPNEPLHYDVQRTGPTGQAGRKREEKKRRKETGEHAEGRRQ